jgi:predicted nucleic acid-binding protein
VRYCVDASAVLAFLIPGQQTSRVRDFWDSLTDNDAVIAPPLLFPECTSVLRVKAFEGAHSHDDALILIRDMLALPIQVEPNKAQFALAHEIANRTRRKKAYDMQYVAVAVLERCEMVTLDGGVYQAAREQRIEARLLR